MRRCAVPTCRRPAAARGWCTGHYTRWSRTGDVRAAEPLRSEPTTELCAVDGCPDPARTRGWCEMHYRRVQRGGDARAHEPKRGTTQRLCEVDGCPNLHDARGYCHGHYLRWRRTGDVQAGLPLGRTEPTYCQVEHDGKTCGRLTHTQGLCRAHYWRLQRHGDVQAHIPVRTAKGNGCICHGYRKVPVPKDLRHLTNGETPINEHRLVMAMHLGRPLAPDEVVHHINGIRTDNRIESLELWSTAHPRVSG